MWESSGLNVILEIIIIMYMKGATWESNKWNIEAYSTNPLGLPTSWLTFNQVSFMVLS